MWDARFSAHTITLSLCKLSRFSSYMEKDWIRWLGHRCRYWIVERFADFTCSCVLCSGTRLLLLAGFEEGSFSFHSPGTHYWSISSDPLQYPCCSRPKFLSGADKYARRACLVDKYLHPSNW